MVLFQDPEKRCGRLLDIQYIKASSIPGLDHLELWDNVFTGPKYQENVCNIKQSPLATYDHDNYWRGNARRT